MRRSAEASKAGHSTPCTAAALAGATLLILPGALRRAAERNVTRIKLDCTGARERRATHTGTYAHARSRRLQLAQMGRPSHLSLRPVRNRVKYVSALLETGCATDRGRTCTPWECGAACAVCIDAPRRSRRYGSCQSCCTANVARHVSVAARTARRGRGERTHHGMHAWRRARREGREVAKGVEEAKAGRQRSLSVGYCGVRTSSPAGKG